MTLCWYCDDRKPATRPVRGVEFEACDECAAEFCAAERNMHTCPFASEIHGDDATLCSCIDAEQAECAGDI